MKKKDLDKQKLAVDRALKLMELNKTPERKQFEEEYSCYIFSLRPTNAITPEEKIKWTIDTWYKVKKGDYDNISQMLTFIKLRARFNMATVYGVWLPNTFNTTGLDKIDEPELYYDLIWKYKFKM